MENLLLINALGRIRRETLDGRSYLVAPATSIVPGVLEGSKGKLYYPPEEIGRNVDTWNGRPLTLYHPNDPLTNEPLSARDPGVLERQGVGFLANTEQAKDGKLKHEAWFDEDRVASLAPNVHTSLLNNRPIELSTGLYTRNEPAEPGSRDKKGREYTHVARDYRPDHLAVLPDQVGACSLRDGCGVLVNKSGDTLCLNQSAVQRATAMKPGSKEHRDALLTQLGRVYFELSRNAQTRHTESGQFRGKTPQPQGVHDSAQIGSKAGPHHRDSFEGADEELDEQDASSELVGTDNPEGEDGRQLATLDHEGDDLWTEPDDHQNPKSGPDELKRAAEKVGVKNAGVGADIRAAQAAARTASKPFEPKPGKPKKKGMTPTPGGQPAPASPAGGTAPEPTANEDELMENDAPKEIHNMFGDPSTAHDASKQAGAASFLTGHKDARDAAADAHDSSADGEHEDASTAHTKAAQAHEDAATTARKQGKSEVANDHDQAAAAHRKAASMHTAECTQNQGTSPNKESGTMPKLKKLTFNGASREQRAAKLTQLRPRMLEILTANCGCDKEKRGLGLLNNETLLAVWNAKAEGSNADAQGSGTVQAGGEEKDDEGEDGVSGSDSDEGEGLKTTPQKAKGTPAVIKNAQLNQADQEVLNYGRQAMQRDKAAIVRQLTGNTARQQELMKLPLRALQNQLALAHEFAVNQGLVPQQQVQQTVTANADLLEPEAQSYLGAGAPFDGSVVQNAGDDQDLLPVPDGLDVVANNGFDQTGASPRLLKMVENQNGIGNGLRRIERA